MVQVYFLIDLKTVFISVNGQDMISLALHKDKGHKQAKGFNWIKQHYTTLFSCDISHLMERNHMSLQLRKNAFMDLHEYFCWFTLLILLFSFVLLTVLITSTFNGCSSLK